MPELTKVEPQKTVGYVDRGYNHSKRQARMDEEEKEIARLEAIARGEEVDDEEPTHRKQEAQVETKQQEEQQQQEEDDSNLSAEEKSFKKRYGDMRRHLAEKEKEYKTKIAELEERINKGPQGIRPPKTDEDIEQWARKYPDVAGIVETIAAKKAKELFARAESRLEELDKMQYQAERTKAENVIRNAHPDFDDLRDSDGFHTWAEDQPKWVQDALYENSDDPASVIRVIDLYKIDNGKTPSDYKKKAKEAAKTVSRGERAKVDAGGADGVFKESQVAKMSASEYEANMDAIDKAIRSGKFIYDLSGAAR